MSYKSKLKILLSCIQASAILSMTALQLPVISHAAEEMKDSGIDYTELAETISNPGAGYTSTVWAVCKPGNTPVYSPTADLVLFFIDIGNFSSGSNGTTDENGNYTPGTDYDLDDAFFESWEQTLRNCYDNGCMVALRFRYDANGRDNPEPDSFEQVLHHIEQIRDSGLLEKYSDIIAYVESGFVGKWGEQHGGKYTSVQYKAQVLEALLQAVPTPIPVTVRTPDIFAEWAGITRSQLADTDLINSLTESAYTTEIQKNKNRIGLYDDGYMGSDSDLGTYANRQIETDWLHQQTFTSYFGGEFSGNLDFAKKYDTYLPENALPEMYKTHLSYINSNIFQLYKDYTFTEDLASRINTENSLNIDNSAYYGQNVHQFIRDHLGYRFVLRDSDLTAETTQDGTAEIDFQIENTGFSGVIPDVQSYVILEQNGMYIIAESDTDCHTWESGTTNLEHLTIDLPDQIQTGDWNVYLKLTMGTDAEIHIMNQRSIRFANADTWNGSLGANYLGTISVKESETPGTDPTFRVNQLPGNDPAVFYFVGNSVTVDGMYSSPYEWQDALFAGSNEDGTEINTCADENYLYIMSNTKKGNAVAPVYNLQFNYGEENERYWIYYQSNGFVYFNHEDYAGCQCKWSDDMVEFRIPLATFGASGATELNLKNLRIFMQDSGNEWKLMSDVTVPEHTVLPDFSILTAYQNISLNPGETYSYTVIPDLAEDTTTYQWQKDHKTIQNATAPTLTLENITEKDAGSYSVTVTSKSGISKTVIAFDLHVTGQALVKGDANADGTCDILDLITLQKWLLCQGGLPAWKNADLDNDNKITIYDFVLVKQLLTT
ncbi:MAG: DUF4832 domain-containing protein [Oscillospiraceae bacterium]|nr:DUF4832 domain-containing protein [Oscillospiraceae bacterium]